MLKKNNIKKPFERGVDGGRLDGQLGIKTVRQDRNARGNASGTAEDFNNWLGSNGHTRRDKAASIISEASSNFGRVFYVFPIGKFDYTFINHCIDLNISRGKWTPVVLEIAFGSPDRILMRYLNSKWEEKIKSEWNPEDATNYLKKNTVTNKNIKKAYDNKWEVWINPKKYYLVEKYLINSFENKGKLLE